MIAYCLCENVIGHKILPAFMKLTRREMHCDDGKNAVGKGKSAAHLHWIYPPHDYSWLWDAARRMSENIPSCTSRQTGDLLSGRKIVWLQVTKISAADAEWRWLPKGWKRWWDDRYCWDYVGFWFWCRFQQTSTLAFLCKYEAVQTGHFKMDVMSSKTYHFGSDSYFCYKRLFESESYQSS